MRPPIDEDLASNELIERLEATFPGEVLAPQRSTSDVEVWQRAMAEGAAVLTGNVVDFLKLAAVHPGHHGVMFVYRQNDSAKDLRAGEIVAGGLAIASSYPSGIAEMVLVVNDFGDE